MSALAEPLHEPPVTGQKPPPGVERSPDFWFKRGDFVLVAGQQVAYRLHADILERKSKVFSDLLDLGADPRPDSEDMMDGCPVVHVTDSAEDFNTFISIIYDGFEHHRQQVETPRWATVKIMIVLGDKYDVSEMREEGLKQLRRWYATDIDEWDKRTNAFFAGLADHLSVANITHTLNDPDLHAAVLYHCCRLPPSYLVVGDPATGCPPLCTEDVTCVLAYLKEMSQDYVDLLIEISEGSLNDTLRACGECRSVSEDVRSTLESYTRIALFYNPYRLLDLSEWGQLSGDIQEIMCKHCFMQYESQLRQARQIYRSELAMHVGPFETPNRF